MSGSRLGALSNNRGSGVLLVNTEGSSWSLTLFKVLERKPDLQVLKMVPAEVCWSKWAPGFRLVAWKKACDEVVEMCLLKCTFLWFAYSIAGLFALPLMNVSFLWALLLFSLSTISALGLGPSQLFIFFSFLPWRYQISADFRAWMWVGWTNNTAWGKWSAPECSCGGTGEKKKNVGAWKSNLIKSFISTVLSLIFFLWANKRFIF